ncbi:hypothetical protein [Neobacillus cucumis]|uniref:hypothetical protein n=1 Tax=Neobacillus cucumis TaxID=1740721 RepID=UPI0028532CCA|nr:hypothetical protein [Neobacillus cucumis]MDR4945315.1 hypothetical protein [Neobacillus cucumis]
MQTMQIIMSIVTVLATVTNVIIAFSNYKIARNNYAITKEKQEKEAMAQRRYQCERVNFRNQEGNVFISNTSNSAISNVIIVITLNNIGPTFDNLLGFPWEHNNVKWIPSIPSGNYKVDFGELDMHGMSKYPVVSALFTDINNNEWFINSKGEIFECQGYWDTVIDKEKLIIPMHPHTHDLEKI